MKKIKIFLPLIILSFISWQSVWTYTSPQIIATVSIGKNKVYCNPVEPCCAIACERVNKVTIANIDTKETRDLKFNKTKPIKTAAWNSNGTLLAIVTSKCDHITQQHQNHLVIWQYRTKTIIYEKELYAYTEQIQKISWNNKNTVIITLKTIVVRASLALGEDSATALFIPSKNSEKVPKKHLFISPDEKFQISTEKKQEQILNIWDRRRKIIIDTITTPVTPTSVDWFHDSKHVVVAGNNGSVLMYSVKDANPYAPKTLSPLRHSYIPPDDFEEEDSDDCASEGICYGVGRDDEYETDYE